MRIVITKKEHNCSFERCSSGKIIQGGTVAITTTYREGILRRTFHFHPDCHTQFTFSNRDKRIREKEEILARRIARKGNKLRGRPRKYSDPLKARNLKQLLMYHRKACNMDKVHDIMVELRKLEGGIHEDKVETR